MQVLGTKDQDVGLTFNDLGHWFPAWLLAFWQLELGYGVPPFDLQGFPPFYFRLQTREYGVEHESTTDLFYYFIILPYLLVSTAWTMSTFRYCARRRLHEFPFLRAGSFLILSMTHSDWVLP